MRNPNKFIALGNHKMSFSIDGKTAIITGAANGIGASIARQFAENGANVMYADIDEKSLKKELGETAEDSNVRYFAGDLREKLTLANLLSATVDAFDRVDVLVNASRQMATTDPLDMDDETVEKLLQQNLMTSLRLSQMVAKRMIKQDEEQDHEFAGTIINLSSIAARLTQPELLAYSISTAALEQMTRSMAVALAQHRIRVNAVSFGSVMSASLQVKLRENPDFRKEIEAHTPAGRIAPASDVVEAVHFLASNAAGFITGQVINADGGRSLIDPVSIAAH